MISLPELVARLVPQRERGAFNAFPFFDAFPLELLVSTLRLVDEWRRPLCRLVCREWNQAILNNSLIRFGSLWLIINKKPYSTRRNWRMTVESEHRVNEVWSFRETPEFPPNYRFETLDLQDIATLDMPIKLLQLAQMSGLKNIRVRFHEHLSELLKPVDFWAECMKLPELERVIVIVLHCYGSEVAWPASFVAEHGRGSLPKLKQLQMNASIVTADDLLFLYENVAEVAYCDVSCSLDEFVKVLKYVMSHPHERYYRYFQVENVEKLRDHLENCDFCNARVFCSSDTDFRIQFDSKWELEGAVDQLNSIDFDCHLIGSPRSSVERIYF